MAIQLAQLEVAFTSSGAGKVKDDIAGVGGSIDEAAAGAGSSLATLAGAAGLVSDAILGVSVKAASSFQSMLNTIQNNTTLTDSQMGQLGDSIKSLSTQSGASLDQLGEAYMHATNFGFSFADSQAIVTAGMQSAVSTGGNVADTVNVLAGAMKEFGLSGSQAANAMDVLHEAAATGNMTLEQMVDSSGKMLSTAANLHVPLTDVAAGMATLTEHGFTAANAGVAMTNMMTKIIAPSAGAQKELAALSKTSGIDLVKDFTSAGLAAKGLPQILDDVAKATGGNADTLHAIFPELRAFQGALALTGTAADDFTREQGLMNDAMAGKITPTAEAYQRTLATLGNQMDRFGASLKVAAINIGSVLLPPLAAIAGVAANAAGAIAAFTAAHAPLVAGILAAVGAIGTWIGGAAAFGAIASANIPIISGLVGAIAAVAAPVLAVAAAAAALYIAWSQNWGGIRGAFASVWSDIQPGLADLAQAISDVTQAGDALVHGDFSSIGDILRGAADSALQGFKQIGGVLLTDIQKPDWRGMFGDAGREIGGALQSAGSISVQLGQWLAQQVAAIPWATVWRGIQSAGSSVLQGLETGANITVQLAQWLQGQIAAVPWATVWSGVQSAGNAILQGLTAGANITAQLTAWLQGQVAGVNWTAVWAGVQGGVSQLGSILGSIDLSPLTSQLQSLGDTLSNAVSQNSAAQTLWDNLKSAAGNDFSKAGTTLGLVGDALGKIAQSQAVAGLFDQIGKSAEQIASAGAPAADILEHIGAGLAAVGAVVLTGILDSLGQLLDILNAGLPGAEQVAEGVLQSLSGAIEVVSSTVSGVVHVIDDIIHGDWTQAWNDAKTAVQGVVDGIVTIVSGIGQQLSGLLAAATGILLVVWNAGWQLLTTTVTTTIAEVTSLAATIGPKIAGAVGDLGNLLFNAGAAVVQGLINGIEAKIGQLASEAGKLGSTITSAVGGFLGIHSPSVVMHKMGEDTGQGMIDGIKAKAPDLKTAAGLMAVGIPEGFAETLLGEGASVSASAANMMKLAIARASDESQGGGAQIADDLMGYIAQELEQNGSLPSAALTRAMTTALRSLSSSGLSDSFLSFVTGSEAATGDQFSSNLVQTMSRAWSQLSDVNRGGSQQSLAAFEDYVQSWIQITGELPTDAWVKSHEQMWSRLANTNKGGSATNAQAFFDYLTQIEGVLGTDLSPQAEAAYERVWLQLSNTSVGGGQQLLGVFTQITEDLANTLGAPLSDAATQALAETLLHVSQTAGAGGVAAAQAIIDNYTQTFQTAPTSQIQAWIARQVQTATPTTTGYTQTPIHAWNPLQRTPAGYQVTPTVDQGQGRANAAIGMGSQLQGQTGVAPSAGYLQQASQFFDSSGQYINQAAQTAAQQFNSALATAITATGSVPSQAFDATLRTILERADDTARGGSQALGDMITTMIATTIDQTGSVPSDSAVRTFGDIITRLGDTLHGGSQQLASDFSNWYSQYIAQNGTAPSDAMQKQIAQLLSSAGDSAHGGSQKLADQLLGTITAQMNANGGVLTESFLKTLQTMFDNGEAKGKSAGTIIGSDIPAAIADGITSNSDLPDEAVKKVLKKVGDDAVSTSKQAGQDAAKAMQEQWAQTVNGSNFAGPKSGGSGGGSPYAQAGGGGGGAPINSTGDNTTYTGYKGGFESLRSADYSYSPLNDILAKGLADLAAAQKNQTITVESNLYLDGEVVASNTSSVIARQLRMNAPLVGAERVR